MDAQQLATDMNMDLSDTIDAYLVNWNIDDDDEWITESTNMEDEDWHSWSLIEWICELVREENDFVLAFLIEQHQLFTDELTTFPPEQGEDASPSL